jgi:hypothetical protein
MGTDEHRLNRTMIISDDDLLNERKFNEVRKALLNEAQGWGKSERDKCLKEQYWNVSQSAYFNLDVRWDYRSLANRLNWEAPDDYLRASSLHECESRRLLSLLSSNFSSNLRYDGIFKNVDENIFLRVVSHWKVGTPLTPPILKLNGDGKLEKFDGFHRLAVAFAAKVERIPFWAKLPANLPGVSQIFR